MTQKSRVTRRKNDKGGVMPGVVCRCGKFESFGFYGIAQMAMGHRLTRVCECGNKIDVQRQRIVSESPASAY